MPPDFSKKVNIIHLVEWIVATCAGAMLADLLCFDCFSHYIKNQFVDATIFGYFIVTSILFFTLCAEEEIPEKTGYAISGLGMCLYLATGIIVAIYFNKMEANLRDSTFYRIIVEIVLCFGNFFIFALEFFLSLFKKDALS